MNEKDGQAAFDAVVGEAADRIAQLHVPGLAVGVIHGANSYAAGIGVTNTSTPQPVTADTTFPICSITKTFTATLAMQLSEQGDLDLNDRIVDILPWFRVKDREATSRARVIDLFHHHTGWSGDHCFDPVPPGGSITEKCMLQARYLEQIVPFDQAWMYNNTNLAFAGHVLSVVGGKPYETLVEERILSPLGMDASCFNYSTSPPDDHFAWGHPPIYADDDIGELEPIFTPFPPTAGSAGGIQSTVHDMLKYARFQLDGKDSSGNTLLSDEALAFAHAPAVDAPTGGFTGLTWFVRNYGEVTSAFHGGTYIGYRTVLQLIPDHDFAVIVLTNGDRGVEAYTTVADAMVSAFTALEHQPAVATGVDPSVLDPFVGVFKGTFQEFEITTNGGRYQLAQTSKLTKPGADPAPADVANTAEGWLIVTEGPNKGALGELLEDPSGERNYLRFNHRIFIRSAEENS
jgi:CubicO group peptidase (beta-lactamase class C family)